LPKGKQNFLKTPKSKRFEEKVSVLLEKTHKTCIFLNLPATCCATKKSPASGTDAEQSPRTFEHAVNPETAEACEDASV